MNLHPIAGPGELIPKSRIEKIYALIAGRKERIG
jgi:hypothetical protein